MNVKFTGESFPMATENVVKIIPLRFTISMKSVAEDKLVSDDFVNHFTSEIWHVVLAER